MRVLTIWLATFFLLVCSGAFAAEITLKDGSLVYGTILSLNDGDDLVIDTAHMDEVTIDWSAIVSIDDTQVVEVQLFDGESLLGQVSVERGVVTVAGDVDTNLDPLSIYSISEVKETFEERLSAYTDVGSNFVRGNSRVTQLSVGAGVGYDSTQFKTSLRMSSIVNEQTDAPDTRRLTLNADYLYKLDDGWGLLGYYQFESDEQQGLDGRSLVGVGAGKMLFNDRLHRLEVIGGLAANIEEFDESPRNESTEAFLGARYRLRWIFDADLGYTVYPSLENSDRIRTELNGSLSMDVWSDLDFKLTLYDRYDSEPPQNNGNNDTGLTLGLSWSF